MTCRIIPFNEKYRSFMSVTCCKTYLINANALWIRHRFFLFNENEQKKCLTQQFKKPKSFTSN